MNKQDYTHYAKFYSIPCYWNNDTQALDGRNKFYGVLLDVAIWIEQQFPTSEDGFPIEIGGEIS